jgi:hypothetical protein
MSLEGPRARPRLESSCSSIESIESQLGWPRAPGPEGLNVSPGGLQTPNVIDVRVLQQGAVGDTISSVHSFLKSKVELEYN